MIKQIILIAILGNINLAFAEKNIEGEYSNNLFILPNHNFAQVAYGTFIKGKYSTYRDTAYFKISQPDLMFNLEVLPNLIGNKLLIEIDSEISEDLYIGFNQDSVSPKLRRIMNAHANCFDDSKMKITFLKEKSSNKIILYNKSENFSQSYSVPDGVNHLRLWKKHDPENLSFNAKIVKEGLMFGSDNNEGTMLYRRQLSESNPDELERIEKAVNEKIFLLKSKPIHLTNIKFNLNSFIQAKCNSE